MCRLWKVFAVEDLDENGNCAKCAEQNKENNMLSKEQITEFETLAKPLIKWLNDNNTNPHASIVIDCDSAQINYGGYAIHTEEFIKD
jgi:type VI protein secretion system component VasK